MRTILSIIPYEYTEYDFFKARNPLKDISSHHFLSKLPEWSVRLDDGKLMRSSEYHQFSGISDVAGGENCFLFDMTPVDLVLSGEIEIAGFEELFNHVDWRTIFKEIPTNSPSKKFYVPSSVHLVVDLDYMDMGDHEYDLDVTIAGFLNEDMVLQEF